MIGVVYCLIQGDPSSTLGILVARGENARSKSQQPQHTQFPHGKRRSEERRRVCYVNHSGRGPFTE